MYSVKAGESGLWIGPKEVVPARNTTTTSREGSIAGLPNK